MKLGPAGSLKVLGPGPEKPSASGAAPRLPCQNHDLPSAETRPPFHLANSLTTAASFLLAFDTPRLVPMTEWQSR